MQRQQRNRLDLTAQAEALRVWAESETGMDFSGTRAQRLHDAAERVLARGKTSASLDQVLNGAPQRGIFLEKLTAELTIGESFFFRNEDHFRALREHVVPAILRDHDENRELRIWSAGCATGEEPYSIAILLDQALRPARERGLDAGAAWRLSILGTDLNPAFLERAREACYRPWSFRHTTIHEQPDYFTRDKESFRLVPRIRGLVRFNYLNLIKDVFPSPLTGTLGLDLILFRNVAIYLRPEITRRIIERFRECLRPGGWLLLGETEVSLAPTEGFEVCRFDRATFHRKPLQAEATTPSPTSRGPVLADPAPSAWQKDAAAPFRSTSTTVPEWVPLPKKCTAGRPASPSHQDAKGSRKDAVESQLAKLIAEGKFAAAESEIDRLGEVRHRAAARFQLVQCLLARAEIAAARRQLARCLADEPLMIEAQLLQASFAEEAGDVKGAESAYRRALYIDRHCPMAHFHLALLMQQQGDTRAAARGIRTVLKLIDGKNPHDLVEYSEGVCYGRLQEMAQLVMNS